MALLQCMIVLMMAVSGTHALVAWSKSSDNAGGCTLPDGRKINHQQVVRHPEMCGNYVCWGKDGTSALNYCQAAVPFQECEETGIHTLGNFPDCCWQCVAYTSC